jgi:hypothetical protein
VSARSITRYWITLIAICLTALGGCSTAPVDMGRTDRAPANLRVECPPMRELPNPTRLGDLVAADSVLAGQYAECAVRVRGWIEWESGRSN